MYISKETKQALIGAAKASLAAVKADPDAPKQVVHLQITVMGENVIQVMVIGPPMLPGLPNDKVELTEGIAIQSIPTAE